MKKVLAFLIAAALLLLFCVSVFGEDASSVISGSVSLPVGYSAADFAAVDPAFLAANSVGNVSVTFSLDGSTYSPLSFGTFVSSSLSGYPSLFFKFNVSDLDPDSLYYIVLPFRSNSSVSLYDFLVTPSSICSFFDFSDAPVISAVLSGSQLKDFVFGFYARSTGFSYDLDGSASLTGSMRPSGSGGFSLTSNASLNATLTGSLLFGNIYGGSGVVNVPDYRLNGAELSLSSLALQPFFKYLSFTFNMALYEPYIVPIDSLVDDPRGVNSISGLASMLSAFWQNQDDDYQESINPDLDDKTNEANQIVQDTENFENDIFTSADNALGKIDIENQKLPDSFSAPFLWIGQLVVALFNQMGDFKIVILFPMYLGLCLLAIGRGSQAIQRLNYKPRYNPVYVFDSAMFQKKVDS